MFSSQGGYCKKAFHHSAHGSRKHSGLIQYEKARQGGLWRPKKDNLNIVDDAILRVFSHQREAEKFKNRCLCSRDVLKQKDIS